MLRRRMEEVQAERARWARRKSRKHLPSGRRFLREMRDDLGLSQPELAEMLQVATKTLQGWEGGKPIPPSSLLLAQILHLFPEVRSWLAGENRRN